ncbi:MAG: hypothetical protein HYT40_02640 [Candidatus Sungbacteria bacterium]|uniref:Baseplate protein J-like domain-containing protein n=1 Tax=Candidatus Sungiibacteriota bacterium TaxID=2750080 RepID=A0A931SBU1_9BACT|nr:hypothetical protein [Candidatus Sungbacteria bacterium]
MANLSENNTSSGATSKTPGSRRVSDIIPPRSRNAVPRQSPPVLKKFTPKPEAPLPTTAPKGVPPPLPSRPEKREINQIDQSVADFFMKRPPTPAAEPASEEAKFTVRSWRPGGRAAPQRVWVWGGGIAGGLIAAAVLLSTVFARVLINIRPVTETMTLPPLSLRVLPDAPAIDPARGVLPGELIEFSETKGFEGTATGKQFVSQRARGSIVISNSYSSQPQVLVVNTRFATKDGKIFRLEKGVTIPGAKIENGVITPSTIAASVVAAEPGASYNVGPSAFIIPGFQGTPKLKGFPAQSAEAFRGGFEGEAVVATDADIKKATESATAEMFAALRESLKTKVPQNFRVVDGAREIAITNVDAPAPKTPGEKFSVKVSGKVSAMMFREADEGDLMAAIFSTTTPRVFIPAKSSFERSAVALDVAKRQLSYVLGGSVALGARLDAEVIRREITSKNSDEITEALKKFPGVEAFKMKIFPVWLWKAPSDPEKIRISIEPFPAS